jgi:hypothetical protein
MDTCVKCGNRFVPTTNTPGYAKDHDGNMYCYVCCAEMDKQGMRDTGKAVLYLSRKYQPTYVLNGRTHRPYQEYVTNWPGTLSIHVHYSKTGRHNMAGTRTTVWFKFEGTDWMGIHYGNDSEICYCRRLKGGK